MVLVLKHDGFEFKSATKSSVNFIYFLQKRYFISALKTLVKFTFIMKNVQFTSAFECVEWLEDLCNLALKNERKINGKDQTSFPFAFNSYKNSLFCTFRLHHSRFKCTFNVVHEKKINGWEISATGKIGSSITEFAFKTWAWKLEIFRLRQLRLKLRKVFSIVLSLTCGASKRCMEFCWRSFANIKSHNSRVYIYLYIF